ncbi:MAG TPA: MFS transporter [Candidatus Dormibacteraeota bacterium]|nr:MFS transporter [Candidatus Dormibacteraeota bacterium]
MTPRPSEGGAPPPPAPGPTPRAADGPGVDAPLVVAASPALPSSGPDASTFVAVLSRRDFRCLWGAQMASQLADKFLVYTLLIVVFALTGRSSTQSLVLLAYTLPSILLSAPAGVYADRHDKRLLMLSTNAIRAFLVLLMPVCLVTPGLSGQPWPLLLITLLFSAVGQVFAPAEAASIPFLVRRDQIMIATSLFMTTVVATLVAGVPLASVAIKVSGTHVPFLIAALLFVVATFLVLRVGTSLRAAGRAHVHEQHVWREMREGLAIMAGDPVLRMGLGQLTVALVVVFTMFALGPAYVARVLGRQPEDTYLLLLPATAGVVGVAVALGRWQASIRRSTALVVSALVAGSILVATGFVPGRLVAGGHGNWLTALTIVLGIGLGAAIGSMLVVGFTVIQERTDEASRGRVFGGIFTVINSASAIPLVGAGAIADAYGVDRAVAVVGALLALHGAVGRTALWRRLQVLDRPASAAPAL